MRINALEVLNFRCFEKHTLKLAPRFTLLIGNNGAGKSALLDAIAIALSAFSSRVSRGHELAIADGDIRRNDFVLPSGKLADVTPTREFAGPTAIALEVNPGAGRKLVLRRQREWNTRRTVTRSERLEEISRDYVDRVQRGNRVTLPMLAYYGTGRMWRAATSGVRSAAGKSRFRGYNGCLDQTGNQNLAFGWFKTNEYSSLHRKKEFPAYAAAKRAVAAMIPDAIKAYWDVASEEIRIHYKAVGKIRSIPFKQLSDGYRNMVGIAADLAQRVATLNPQLTADAIRETPGIVLIDEIDLHLHPIWQREFVGRVMETFPKVQFVATTHSPFIIQSIHGVTGAAVWDIASAAAVEAPKESIEDIAEYIQGVKIPQYSKRYTNMIDAAQHYHAAMEKSRGRDSAEVLEARAKLEQHALGFADNPALQAFVSLQRRAQEKSKN